MSGPIVRSGPSPEFTKNWDSVFGKSKGKAAAPAKKPAKVASKPAKPAKATAKKKKAKR